VKAAPHDSGVEAPRRAKLGNLLEQIAVCRKEEGQARRERINREPGLDRARHVLNRVSERKGELLDRGGASFANMISGNRDRIPVRHIIRAETENLGDQSHARLRGVDVRSTRDVLLEYVVLNGAAQLPRAMPRSSATTMYIASSVAAVALIVIEVET